MNDLQEIKEEIAELVFSGKKEEALLLLEQKYGIDRKEAEKLLKVAVRETMTPAMVLKRIPQSFLKGQGCKGALYGMLAFVFGFFGIPMLLAALGFSGYFYYADQQTIKITGTVTAYESYNDQSQNEQTTPVVTYIVDDKEFSCKGNFYSNPPLYSIGDPIPLAIRPDDPESVYINTFYERWFVTAVLGGVALVFIFLMFVFRILGRRL